MFDELGIYARLDSPLYGALVQTVEILSLTVDADTAAGRVFGSPIRGLSVHTSPKRIAASTEQRPGLLTWPLDPDSVFELMRQRSMHDTIFRPADLPLLHGTPPHSLMRKVHEVRPIVDAIVLSVPVVGQTWAAISLIRCAGRDPFPAQAMDVVGRFRPAIAKRLARGCQLDLTCAQTPDLAPRPNKPAAAAPNPEQLVQRLSRTEREVLSHLRQEKTERQIAQSLHRSPHTIHVHVKSIYRKLAVCSRKELLRMFVRPAVAVL